MRTEFLSSWKVRIGLGTLAFFALLALFGPWLVDLLGVDPRANEIKSISRPPSGEHLLGTNQFGQDVLAQVIAGARGSMYVGVLAAVVGTAMAILVGVPSGYYGGKVDAALNFLTNLFLVMPVLPLILIVAGYLEGTSLTTVALIIGLFGWSGGARTLRAQALSIASRDFVRAMRMLGERGYRLVFFEVLPHLTGLIASMFLHAMIGAVLAEAGLAFLGISDAGAISWGTMIQSAQQQSAVLRGLWWWFVPPGLCIALIGTAAALVNFGVDELANPKLRVARVKKARQPKKLVQAGGSS
ncbi:ABC transporter permease [Streptomyces sp. NPDC058001]|uniref:ABC transporter permease n=1 Tax=Streptomyces sp. NPDC058001 TaxID=3346300 RepID=UPI0036E6BE30